MTEPDKKAQDMYRKQILELAKNPHNYGKLESPITHEFKQENFLCGDGVYVQLNVKEGIVEEVKFKGQGCALCTASASLVTDKVKKMKVEEVKNLSDKDILEILNIPVTPGRMDCAMITLEAIKNALKK